MVTSWRPSTSLKSLENWRFASAAVTVFIQGAPCSDYFHYIQPWLKSHARTGAAFRPRPSPQSFFAASVTAAVQAPVGSLVMTGSDPPDSSVFTVVLAAAVSSAPSEPSVSLLISSIMVV